jgi:hypothetical protein
MGPIEEKQKDEEQEIVEEQKVAGEQKANGDQTLALLAFLLGMLASRYDCRVSFDGQSNDRCAAAQKKIEKGKGK